MGASRTFHDEYYYTVVQRELAPREEDIQLRFGPLTCTLSQLFEQGYYLRAMMPNHYRKNQTRSVKIYLTNGTRRYRLAKRKASEILTKPLSKIIQSQIELTYMGSDEHLSPWEMIHEKYPKAKTKGLIGNMSIDEYVSCQLEKGIL